MSQDGSAASRGVSRRNLLKTGAASLAAVLGGTQAGIDAAAAADSAPSDRDLVLVNGKIHTMDAQSRIAASITIRNGRIIALEYGGHGNQGSHGDQRVIDLKGRTVVPGIIDNHNHIVLMANRPGYHTPLENAYSIAEVQATLAARAAGVPKGQFITTIGGFHSNHFAEHRLPNLAELDAALPDHPVYVSIGFSGPSTTNTRGKAFFEQKSVAVGADSSIAAGTPSGQALLALRQALLTFETRKRAALDALAYGTTVGVTTHLDEGAFQASNTPADGSAHEDNYTMHLPVLELYREELAKVRLRINFLHMEADPALPGLLARLQNAFPFFGSDMVRTGGIGEFIAQGTNAASPFIEAAKRVARAGWRAEVHSLSRTDFQDEIQGFEVANTVADITDLRWVVAHVPFITLDYVNRLKALGGGLSLTGWRYLAGTAAGNGPPFRMIVDNGINVGMSSDGMQIAPMNPWLHMYYATTGVNALGQLINGGQQITREEVLRLYTRDNGWFLREEDQLGSLELGKLGDLVVLNSDYFTVADADLKKVRSILTVVGGNIVYDAGVLKVK